jgi:G:T-mismatch repair DNA endonuclease (very short patch repair protein)
VDVFIEPSTIIEVLGCYWHKHGCQEPKSGWSDEDLAVQEKDAARLAFLRGRGYTVIEIWECEINEHPDRVQARLRKLRT